MKEYLKWIFQFWKGEKLHILLLIAFTIISSLVSLSLPFIFKFIIDNIEDVLKNSNEVMDFNKFIYFLVILAFAQFVAGLYPGARAWLNSKIGLKIRNKVFKSILKKDYKFFNKFTPGDLTTRLTDDIIEYPRIAWFSCSAIFRALESSSRLIFCLVVMFIMSWQLTLLALIPLPIMLYIFYIIKNRLEKIVERNRRYTSNINNLLDSTFAGISVIKSYCAEKGQSERLEKLLNKKIITDYDITKLVTIIHSSYSILGQIGKVVIMFVGGLFVIWNKIGMGDFFAFYIYLDMILMPMMDIPNLFVTSRQAFISIDREKEILNFPDKIINDGENKIISIDKVEFRNVSFSYNNNPVIRNLNFIVNKGESYAIVGEVGSGKSTVLGLLSGLLQIGNGEILINNQLYENVEKRSFLNQIGYVSQDTILFSGSISENIKIGREFNSKKIGNVLEAVNLNQEIIEGKDKILTQSGGGLSGGQKQRVAIARALISNPSLLLLDDSTSALDAETESFFWESLQNKIKNIIIVVVSHRLSTIKQCDKIIFIHRGKIVSIDNHNNLLKNKLYKEVLATEIKKN